jgi:copper oxidase (laccase) domain-containing protein
MDAIAERMDKWHIDLPNCCRLQLESTGIPSANIRLTDICTYDHTDDFFSARKLGTSSGRILTGIVLR